MARLEFVIYAKFSRDCIAATVNTVDPRTFTEAYWGQITRPTTASERAYPSDLGDELAALWALQSVRRKLEEQSCNLATVDFTLRAVTVDFVELDF